MPVHARFCKRRDDVNRVVFSRSVDQKRDQVVLEQSFGQLDLFPEPTQSGLVPQKKEYLFGQFTYGGSSVKVLDTNAEYSQRVLNMPPLLFKIVRPLFRAGSKVFPPLPPHIPNLGDEIRVWQLYDLSWIGRGDLDCLLESIRQAAKKNNVNYLVICMGQKDAGFDLISKKAWIRPRYHLFFYAPPQGRTGSTGDAHLF